MVSWRQEREYWSVQERVEGSVVKYYAVSKDGREEPAFGFLTEAEADAWIDGYAQGCYENY